MEENAPFIFDHISDEDLNHFNQLKNILDKINIPYFHDKKLVRGLDYYTRTTFEITSKNLGAQDALCGGGRYDKLVNQLGGKNTPAVGFAAGVERLLLLINDDTFDQSDNVKIFISILGEQNIPDAMKIASDLRKNTNLNINIESNRRSLKSQMREANRQKCSYVIIIGENELQNKIVLIKNMKNGEQENIAIKDLNTYFDKNIWFKVKKIIVNRGIIWNIFHGMLME